jgi:hypothetical protein
MSATTADNLLRCEAHTRTAHKKEQAAQRISSRFPNGIEIFGPAEDVAQAQKSAAKYGITASVISIDPRRLHELCELDVQFYTSYADECIFWQGSVEAAQRGERRSR